MISSFVAFLISLTLPAQSNALADASFVTPWSVAIASVATDAPAPAVMPTPVTVPAVVTAPAPAPTLEPALTPTMTPAPVAPATPSLLQASIFDPNALAGIPLGQGKRLSADQVVGKVQAFYKDTRQLKAKFRQTVVNKTFGKKNVSDGWVYIKKPGKMRWDYYGKKNKKKVIKSFLSDGNTIWAVFVTDMQYFKKAVKNDLLPVAITFLSGKGDLRTDFRAGLDTKTAYGKKGDYVVKLTPKKPNAQYKTLWLVVDPTNYRVKKSVVENSNGDTNQFSFHEGNTTKPIADNVFVFNEKNTKFRLINPEKAPR